MSKYKTIVAKFMISIILISGLIGCGKSKIELINENLNSSKYEEAIKIFNNIKDEEDKQKAIEIMKKQDSILKEKFINKEINRDTAVEYLNILKSVSENKDEVDKTIHEIDELVMSQEAYDAGIKSMKNNEYKKAINQFSAVLENDKSNYNNAQNKIKEVEELAKSTVLVTIDECKIAYSNSNKKSMYPDQLQIKVTNHFDKTIKNFNVCFIGYDSENHPIEIPGYLSESQGFEFMGTGQNVNIPKDGTWGNGTMGWNIGSSEKLSRVEANIKEIEFEDGTIWANPLYDLWIQRSLGEEW